MTPTSHPDTPPLKNRPPTLQSQAILAGDSITTNEPGKRFQAWDDVPALFRSGNNSLPDPWQDLFGPLRASGQVVVGQIGQSLDGRIATPKGHSHYVNGDDGLAHLHRLRALVDAVVVGIGTVIADDPQLTVRRVSGPHPARVVIDPNGKLPRDARVLADDGVRRIVITAEDTQWPPGVELLPVKPIAGSLPPQAMLAGLHGL